MADVKVVNRVAMARLDLYLQHWETYPSYFKGCEGLAADLMAGCRRDVESGGNGPGPWMALADLIEECGERTAIRTVVKCYYLPLPQEK